MSDWFQGLISCHSAQHDEIPCIYLQRRLSLYNLSFFCSLLLLKCSSRLWNQWRCFTTHEKSGFIVMWVVARVRTISESSCNKICHHVTTQKNKQESNLKRLFAKVSAWNCQNVSLTSSSKEWSKHSVNKAAQNFQKKKKNLTGWLNSMSFLLHLEKL